MTKGSLYDETVKNPAHIADDDSIVQLMINERYDKFVLLSSGRVFKSRARGQSGSYEGWKEVDLLGEIKFDLKI